MVVWGLILLGYALWRSAASPTPFGRRRRDDSARWNGQALWIIGELALDIVAVMSTGYWASPFVFCLVTAVIAAGIDSGFATAARNAGLAVLAVGIPFLITFPEADAVRVSAQWGMELLLVALVAGYTHHLFGQAEERHSVALERMGQLTEANELLISLHRLAQSMPASLNLEEALASTVNRLRGLVDCDVTAVLLRDDVTSRWVVAVGDGTRLEGSLHVDELPAPLQAATTSSVASLVVCLGPGEGIGVDSLSRSGLYAPLRARGTLVGLIALEHHEPGCYGRRELGLLDGFIGPAALSIDNARWFGRLRAMGADEERVRIARDIHDSVGQSLASVAWGLDSVAGRAKKGPLRDDLEELRAQVRGVLVDVRETLSDLRTDVSDERGLVDTLESFLQRLRARRDITVRFTAEGHGRLAVVQERELWHIAHEAITNVERHACADSVDVLWRYDGHHAILSICDDGQGFEVNRDGRRDSYGLLGMQERADAIGARLDIASGPGGTTVRCELTAA